MGRWTAASDFDYWALVTRERRQIQTEADAKQYQDDRDRPDDERPDDAQDSSGESTD